MGPFCIFAEIRSNSSIKNKLKQLMSNSKISAAAFADTKPHYDLLDGLRGVAALMVIFYHVFEAFATSPIDQQFNHGYLAVDFFFILSGFVIGYAYDDRWKTMTTKDFIKRRLIRLHPMVVLGAVLGVIAFCIQGCEKWDGTHVSISMVMLALLINLFLIPAVPGSGPEIRGNGEMFLCSSSISGILCMPCLFVGCQRRRLRHLLSWRESDWLRSLYSIFPVRGT